MPVSTTVRLIHILLLVGMSSSVQHVAVKIPEVDFQYIVNVMQRKYGLNYGDAANCVYELEHFYTGVKYNAIDSDVDHPEAAVRAAWETHIISTAVYFNFTNSTFGAYLHYKSIRQEKGQLYVFHKLEEFGINDMNETVWLFKDRHYHTYYLPPASWTVFYEQSNSAADFNQNVNRFLKTFIEGYYPTPKSIHVLDIAMGQGRNSIWLAQRGYHVTGFDSSTGGIEMAIKQARKLNLTRLQAYAIDAEKFQFGIGQWDVILCMYFPIINETSYRQRLEQSLKYNGLLIVEVFHWDSFRGEHRIPVGVAYRTNAIPSLFPNLTTLIYDKPIDLSDFGNTPTKIIRYVGQKQFTDAN